MKNPPPRFPRFDIALTIAARFRICFLIIAEHRLSAGVTP
jgi:hypothetical protein